MKAAIAGTGLVGASIGMALRSAGWTVGGWDPDPEAAARAKELGALDTVHGSLAELADADVLLLAGPPVAIRETVRDLATDALVVDVAGVKGDIVHAARHLPHFVGTHPMAGREHPGPDAASAALFKGAAWIVVTDDADEADLARVGEMVRILGAEPVMMSAAEHDEAVATVSHLPQVVAAALVHDAATSERALSLAAGSFRDLTRVALSDPELWAELLLANRVEVVDAVRRLGSQLGAWADAIDEGASAELVERLSAAQGIRRAMAPPLMTVDVVLEDRPGELAAVGRALAASRVDVRDLQLRHGRLGGGGVLMLSVRPGEGHALRRALSDEGFVLDD